MDFNIKYVHKCDIYTFYKFVHFIKLFKPNAQETNNYFQYFRS